MVAARADLSHHRALRRIAQVVPRRRDRQAVLGDFPCSGGIGKVFIAKLAVIIRGISVLGAGHLFLRDIRHNVVVRHITQGEVQRPYVDLRALLAAVCLVGLYAPRSVFIGGIGRCGGGLLAEANALRRAVDIARKGAVIRQDGALRDR